MRRSFNRRAAAAARLKNSTLLEPLVILERVTAVIRAEGRSSRLRPPDHIKGRFGVYALHFELFDWGSVLRMVVVSPGGKKTAIYLNERTLEELEC